jgi:hypothetical protein
MTDPAGRQEEWAGVDKEEPFDLVRSRPRNRVQPSGLVWRAPTQIAQMRSREAESASAGPAAAPSDEVDPLWSAIAPRRASRRRRAAQVIGAILLTAALVVGVRMIASSPSAREEALSWVTLGHSQEAGRAWQAAESKVRGLVGM